MQSLEDLILLPLIETSIILKNYPVDFVISMRHGCDMIYVKKHAMKSNTERHLLKFSGKKKLMINLGIVRPFLAPEQPAKTYFVVKLQWFSLLLPSSFFLCYRYAADLKSNAEFGTGSHNHIQIK